MRKIGHPRSIVILLGAGLGCAVLMFPLMMAVLGGHMWLTGRTETADTDPYFHNAVPLVGVVPAAALGWLLGRRTPAPLARTAGGPAAGAALLAVGVLLFLLLTGRALRRGPGAATVGVLLWGAGLALAALAATALLRRGRRGPALAVAVAGAVASCAAGVTALVALDHPDAPLRHAGRWFAALTVAPGADLGDGVNFRLRTEVDLLNGLLLTVAAFGLAYLLTSARTPPGGVPGGVAAPAVRAT